MRPRLDVLPPQQQRLWPELAQVPCHFVLYGGTAIALRLGGRQSVDFDFFTNEPLSFDAPGWDIPFLRGAELIQSGPNTAAYAVDRAGEIKVAFFGGLTIGRAGSPDRCQDNGVRVASLLDLAAQKVKVLLVRAEPKDYMDIHTLIKAGIALPDALGAARALYPEFNPLLSLKALAYYGEASLAGVPANVREFLTAESARVESIKTVPKIASTVGA